jgi:DNA-binding NarL/FixJ family response regulator
MTVRFSDRDLFEVLDRLDEGSLVCVVAEEETTHANAALRAMLAHDPDREDIQRELDRLLEVIREGSEQQPTALRQNVTSRTLEVQTPLASYRLRGSLIQPAVPNERPPLALIAVQRVPLDSLSHAELRRKYRFTRREAEVARLLVTGTPNGAIASALGISPHTTHHYTEHVMLKLGVRTRSEVAATILLDGQALPLPSAHE